MTNECAPSVLAIPVANAAVCLNCDVVTEIVEQCPACSSEHLMPLARWLGQAAPSEET